MSTITAPSQERDDKKPIAASKSSKDDCLAYVKRGSETAILLAKWGLGITVVCFIAALGVAYVYLCPMTHTAPTTPDVNVPAVESIIHLSLLSCGMLAGMTVIALGVGLFFMGIRGDMSLAATGGGARFQATAMAPGTAIILFGVVLLAICATRPCPFERANSQIPQSSTSSGMQTGASKR